MKKYIIYYVLFITLKILFMIGHMLFDGKVFLDFYNCSSIFFSISVFYSVILNLDSRRLGSNYYWLAFGKVYSDYPNGVVKYELSSIL